MTTMLTASARIPWMSGRNPRFLGLPPALLADFPAVLAASRLSPRGDTVSSTLTSPQNLRSKRKE
jgi:hypothetical protein